MAPAVKESCDGMGITAQIENAGGIVLEGVFFYNMHAREIGEAKGWRRLISNSAKIVNSRRLWVRTGIVVHGKFVASAITGRIVR